MLVKEGTEPAQLSHPYLTGLSQVLLGVIAADTQRGAPAVRAPEYCGLTYTYTHLVAVLFTTTPLVIQTRHTAATGYQAFQQFVQVWPRSGLGGLVLLLM